MKDIDHQFTKEVVCPYCGFVNSESYEYFDYSDESEITCNDCDKVYDASRYIRVDFSTNKNCKLNDEEHDWVKSDLKNGFTSAGKIYDPYYVWTCSKCEQSSHKDPENNEEGK